MVRLLLRRSVAAGVLHLSSSYQSSRFVTAIGATVVTKALPLLTTAPSRPGDTHNAPSARMIAAIVSGCVLMTSAQPPLCLPPDGPSTSVALPMANIQGSAPSTAKGKSFAVKAANRFIDSASSQGRGVHVFLHSDPAPPLILTPLHPNAGSTRPHSMTFQATCCQTRSFGAS